MCYNKETSLATYVLGVSLSIALFILGDNYDKHIAFFTFVFIQIQLCEYFMWSDQKCGKINHYATKCAKIALMLQPFSILIGAYLFKTTTINRNILILLILVSLAIIVIMLYSTITDKKKRCSKESVNPKDRGFLEWDFSTIIKKWDISSSFVYIFYFVIMFLPWLFMKNKLKGILSFTIIMVTFIYSFYSLDREKDLRIEIFRQWESRWCFTASVYPVVFLLLKTIF